MGRNMPGAGSFVCPMPPRNISTADPALGLPPEKVIRRTAATYDSNLNSVPIVVTVLFFAHNPSPRLRWSIGVGWEITPAEVFVPGAPTFGPPTWQMRAIRLPPQGGSAADLNDVFVTAGVATARVLPDAYELDSAIKDVRGTLTLHRGGGEDLQPNVDAALVIEARWEPRDGCWSPDLLQLIERADLSVQGSIVVLENGT